MATYYMNKEVQEIAEITGKTVEELAVELSLNDHGRRGCEAWNRSEQNRVLRMLGEVKDAKKAKELREERLSTYHWVKVEGEWLVSGNFTGKTEGQTITIMKASGEKQERQIVSIEGQYATVK